MTPILELVFRLSRLGPVLRPHVLPDGLAPDGKFPVPVFPTDVGEPQKVQRLRLAFPFFVSGSARQTAGIRSRNLKKCKGILDTAH